MKRIIYTYSGEGNGFALTRHLQVSHEDEASGSVITINVLKNDGPCFIIKDFSMKNIVADPSDSDVHFQDVNIPLSGAISDDLKSKIKEDIPHLLSQQKKEDRGIFTQKDPGYDILTIIFSILNEKIKIKEKVEKTFKCPAELLDL
jgi:hypothetical protein